MSVRGRAFYTADSAVRGSRTSLGNHLVPFYGGPLCIALGAFYRCGTSSISFKHVAVSESLRLYVTAVLAFRGLGAGRGTVRMTL